MPSSPQDRTVSGTFVDSTSADRAAEAARNSGFVVERRSDGAVVVHVGEQEQHVAEVEGILAAYGAREVGGSTAAASTPAAAAQTASQPVGPEPRPGPEQRVRAESGARVELREERLEATTRPVQTGEITIRKEVVTQTRRVEVPVRREELVVERRPIERRPIAAAEPAADPLIQQLVDRLRHMREGEELRIPIVQEEVVVQTRPVVVEEITLGKRVIQETQTFSETVRREEAHIESQGGARVHNQ